MVSLIDESIRLDEINKLDYKHDDTYINLMDQEWVIKAIHSENEKLAEYVGRLCKRIWPSGYQLLADGEYVIFADHFYNPIVKLTRNEIVRMMDRSLLDLPEIMKLSILPKQLIKLLKWHGFIHFANQYGEDLFNKLVSHQDEVIKHYDGILKTYSRFVNKGVD